MKTRFFAGFFLAVTILFVAQTATAQQHQPSRQPAYSRLQVATPYAQQHLSDIMAVLNVQFEIDLLSGPVPNAEAQLVAYRSGQQQRRIIYNRQLLNQAKRANPWAPRWILAHEVAHHARGHLVPQRFNQTHPWKRELEADTVAGCAVARLGASLNDAAEALRFWFFDLAGSDSHPPVDRRLHAVREGWMTCSR